jgi:hypothetical protein
MARDAITAPPGSGLQNEARRSMEGNEQDHFGVEDRAAKRLAKNKFCRIIKA